MTIYFQLILGAILLSIVHASIPNHWIPLIALSKSEKWSQKLTLAVTAIAGFAHTISTVIIGIIIGFLGYKLSGSYSFIIEVVAPGLLFILGIVYLILSIRTNRRHHHHGINLENAKKKNINAIVIALSISMFLSPCIEIEAYFFTASSLGWIGIITVSVIYIIITIIGMLVLVWLGLRGMRKIKSHFLEHYGKTITGVLLILLGVVGYFIH